ncbi:MAG: copper chaperone PCu(A)C [Herminiimonas sp.]|nr:copper chaperone PCu(A)C [Herminiimonas sp.]
MKLRLLFLALALPVSMLAAGANIGASPMQIRHAHARATVPNQPAGAAYVTLENTGKSADRLVSLSSPVANRVEMHTMTMDGNLMKMRQVEAIELKPAGLVTMKPGDGYHLMLTGLKKPLKTGESFPMTLRFEKAGRVRIMVTVEAIAPAAADH